MTTAIVLILRRLPSLNRRVTKCRIQHFVSSKNNSYYFSPRPPTDDDDENKDPQELDPYWKSLESRLSFRKLRPRGSGPGRSSVPLSEEDIREKAGFYDICNKSDAVNQKK